MAMQYFPYNHLKIILKNVEQEILYRNVQFVQSCRKRETIGSLVVSIVYGEHQNMGLEEKI